MTNPLALACFILGAALLAWAYVAGIIDYIERDRVRRQIEKAIRRMDEEES